MATVPSWVPGNLTDIVFSNCTLAAKFWSQAQTTNDVPIQQTVELLANGFQGYWAANNVTPPTPGDIAKFVIDSVQSTDQTVVNGVVLAAQIFIRDNCMAVYCKILPWQGNADLSGRGMLVSYFVQAGLVTFYMLTLGLGRLNKSSRLFKKSPKYERVLVAVQESTKSFLDASMLFCLVMLVATLYIFARALANPNALITTYIQFSSALISIFTIFPTIVLHACASNHLRRGRFRQGVWWFVGCLTVTVIALFLNVGSSAIVGLRARNEDAAANVAAVNSTESYLDKVIDSEAQNLWEVNCVEDNVLYGFLTVIVSTMCLVAVFTLFYVLFVKNIARIPFLKSKGRPRLKKFRKNWWWVSGILAFFGMWATLIMFVYYRSAFNRNAGTTNKDDEWSFGQILALSTWVPVVVELLFIGRKGAISALTGQLSDKYQVVLAPEVVRRDTDITLASVGDSDEEKGKYAPVDVTSVSPRTSK